MRTSTVPRGRDTTLFGLYAWAMAVSTALAVAVALMSTRTAPQYSASAEILISPTITSSGNYIQPSMPTEQRVATSAEVISAASAELGVTAARPLQHLAVTVPVDTQVLVMTYTADTPAAALAGAKVFAKTYLKTRNPADGKDPVASLVSPPTLPSAPVGTNYPVVLGVAVLGGLLVGFGLARAWDRVRGRIRTIDDAERCTGLESLALTPHLRPAAGHDRIVGAVQPQLDSLAARVLGQIEADSQSCLLVSGVARGCGSTSVAVLTAMALARMGRVVVLVTADDDVVSGLSKDSRREVKEVSGDKWPDARATDHDGLHLVAVNEWDSAGMAAARLTNLLPELHERLPEALIVIDGPPAWYCSGLALRADRILLVVGLGRSPRTTTAAAVQCLDHCHAKLMGLVVTPHRRHVRERIAGMWGRLYLGVRWLSLALAPLSGGLDQQEGRPGGSDVIKTRDIGRLPQPLPSGEPTGSVAS